MHGLGAPRPPDPKVRAAARVAPVADPGLTPETGRSITRSLTERRSGFLRELTSGPPADHGPPGVTETLIAAPSRKTVSDCLALDFCVASH